LNAEGSLLSSAEKKTVELIQKKSRMTGCPYSGKIKLDIFHKKITVQDMNGILINRVNTPEDLEY